MKSSLKSRALRYFLYSLAVLPIFIFRDFTLDNELRYLSIADEALRKGTIFTFTNHGILYADKPPLYLWIVMLGKQLFGFHSMVFLGFFSFAPALVIIFTMDRWVKEHLSEDQRLSGELMMLTSVFFIGTAIVLRMDMLMCMFIVLSLYLFFRIYSGKAQRWDSLLFSLCIFMALFSKGPLGIIIPLVSTTVFLILKKEIRTMGRYWGLKTWILLLALCALWFAGVYAEGGNKYLNDLVFNQTFNRAVNSFHHKEPFYYYLVAIWYSLAPWSLLLIGVMVMGIIKKLFSSDLELFFLVTALSTLAVLSLFSAKLQVYMLPSFPFIIYLCLLWLARLHLHRWISLLVIIPAIVLCLALPGAILARLFGFSTPSLLFLAAFILSVAGILALVNLRRSRLNGGIITIGAGILMAVFVFSFAIPKYNSMIGLSELCQKAKNISSQKKAANYYYCKIIRADNLDVYLGVEPAKLRIKDLYQDEDKIRKPAILFLSNKYVVRSDSIRLYLKGKKIHQLGNYYCVEIE